jgi:hypothetical protein
MKERFCSSIYTPKRCMKEAFSVTTSRHSSAVPRSGLSDPRERGVSPRDMQDFAHELRQPLSTIESLAYYLEMTESDEQVSRHLQRIRAMVYKAHQILNEAIPS